MRNWLIDLQPLLIYPDYRRWWISFSLSAIGNHLTVFAVTLQIFTITKNSLAIGAIGLFTGIPAIFMALWGGALGDRFDRRKVVFIATSLQLVGCVALLMNILLGGSNIFVLYCLIGGIFLLGALNVPASSAILPQLVAPQHLQAAITLSMFSMHTAMIVGPLIGGFLVTKCSIATLYFIDLLSFCGALYGIIRLPLVNSASNLNKKSWAAIKAGLTFIVGVPIIWGALYVDLSLAFFGMPNALLPIINDNYFNGHPKYLGLMIATPSIGGLIAMLLSGKLNYLQSPAIIMIVLCILWALSVLAFSMNYSLALSLLLLFFMGAFDSLIATLRSTIIQQVTSDEYRTRVSAVEYIVGNIAPQLGNFRAGLLGMIIAPNIAVLIGGLTTLIITLITPLLFPAFVRFRRTF